MSIASQYVRGRYVRKPALELHYYPLNDANMKLIEQVLIADSLLKYDSI